MVVFENTMVSDLSPLLELNNLERLSFKNTRVGDLSTLMELKSLRKLWLYNPQMSDEQVQELRQALPNCHFPRTADVEK